MRDIHFSKHNAEANERYKLGEGTITATATVTGTTTPDISGVFVQSGTYNGQPQYINGAFALRYSTWNWWEITNSDHSVFWYKSSEPYTTITGQYYYGDGATGTPTVQLT